MFSFPICHWSGASGGGGPPSGGLTKYIRDGKTEFSPFTIGGNDMIRRTSDDRFLLVYQSSEIRMMKWNPGSGSFSQVGNSMILPSPSLFPNITVLDGTVNAEEFAFIEGNADALQRWRFDGVNFFQVGLDTVVDTFSSVVHLMSALTPTTLVYYGQTNDALTHYFWNGTSWVATGALLPINQLAASDKMIALDANHIVISDSGILRVHYFDGINFGGEIYNLDTGRGPSDDIHAIDSGSFWSVEGYTSGNALFSGNDRRVVKFLWDGISITEDNSFVSHGFISTAPKSVAPLSSSLEDYVILDSKGPDGEDLVHYSKTSVSTTRTPPNLPSLCAWWDLTLNQCYDGNVISGLKNAEPSPADGSNSAAWDLHFGNDINIDSSNPIFVGSVNSPLAACSFDGIEKCFTQKNSIINTPLLRDMHKTSSQWYFIWIGKNNSANSRAFMGTGYTGTNNGLSLLHTSAPGEELEIAQHHGSGTSDIDVAFTMGNQLEGFIVSVDMSSSTNNIRVWDFALSGGSGSTIAIEHSFPFTANSTNALGLFRLLAADNGLGTTALKHLNIGHFIAAGIGNTFLANGAQITEIYDSLETMHVRDYRR